MIYPKRDMQSKSPSDCSIDLFSILWFYCRLWFIVSDDWRFDLKRNQYFPLKNSHSTAVVFPSVLFYHIASQQTGYTVAVYFSNIIGKYCRWWFSMTVVIISLPRPWREFSGYRWILTSAKVHSSLMTVSLKRQFLLYMAA